MKYLIKAKPTNTLRTAEGIYLDEFRFKVISGPMSDINNWTARRLIDIKSQLLDVATDEAYLDLLKKYDNEDKAVSEFLKSYALDSEPKTEPKAEAEAEPKLDEKVEEVTPTVEELAATVEELTETVEELTETVGEKVAPTPQTKGNKYSKR